MLLQNYDRIQPKIFNRMRFPKIEKPFPIHINWFHAVQPRVSEEAINRQMHRHRFYEAHFVVNGSASYKDGSGRIFDLPEGFGVLISPEVDHIIESIGEDMVKFSLTFSIDEGSDFHKSLAGKICSFPLSSELVGCIDTMLWHIARSSEFSETVLTNRLIELIFHLSEACNTQSVVNSTLTEHCQDHRVTMARTFVRDNDHLFLSCKEVAAHCHLSVKHLERLFFAETGQKLLDFIHATKLESAKGQLADTYHSLERISEDLGFSSVHYFHRFFTKNCGMTPATYRRTIGIVPDDSGK